MAWNVLECIDSTVLHGCYAELGPLSSILALLSNLRLAHKVGKTANRPTCHFGYVHG